MWQCLGAVILGLLPTALAVMCSPQTAHTEGGTWPPAPEAILPWGQSLKPMPLAVGD